MKPADGWLAGASGSALLLVLFASASAQDTAQSTLKQICDQSAASPLDPERPAGASGVAPDKIDTKIAIPSCEAALVADPQNARLMYQLGRAHFAAKNYEKAKSLYEQAATGGKVEAMHNLGLLYVKGLGTARDPSVARKWFDKAAERGFSLSMDSIGVMYYQGDGVERDYVAARRWFEKAAAAGAEIAKEHLARLNPTERAGTGGFVGSWQIYAGTDPITRRPVFSAYATHIDSEWVGVRCGGDGVPLLLLGTDARAFKDGEQIEADLRVDDGAVVNTVFFGTANPHVLATAFVHSFYESFLDAKRFAVNLHAGQASGFTFEYQFEETGKALKNMPTHCPAYNAVAPGMIM